MLDAEVTILPEHRGSMRRIVNLAATLRENGAIGHKALITNLSESGCQIHWDAQIEEGAEVFVKLTTQFPLRATIMWSKDGIAGCKFATPLTATAILGLTSNRHLQGKRLFGPGRSGGRSASQTP
ncbi:MAG TPA: PilZ domain-containing protein [Allosphingosinicella sp.]|nr:PilZ domain-containing protein [Allosphingosinicella sp.]